MTVIAVGKTQLTAYHLYLFKFIPILLTIRFNMAQLEIVSPRIVYLCFAPGLIPTLHHMADIIWHFIPQLHLVRYSETCL